jgi:aspartate/methionine/tyrosine aminotransferase
MDMRVDGRRGTFLHLKYPRTLQREGAFSLRPSNDRLIEWILGLGPGARYNLTSSGLTEPPLVAMGVDTSFERFAAMKDEHERHFAEEVASLYGVDPSAVVPTDGASEAIFLVYSVLGEGRKAVVPLPNYGPMYGVPWSLGMEVGRSLPDAAKAKGVIFGFTDPNNPTGRSQDAGTLDGIIDSAGRRGNIVFVNETYKEFTFPPSPASCFRDTGSVVVCNTMTKFYGLGRLRVGWIVAGKRAARLLSYAKIAVTGHNSEYSLWVAAQVLKNRQRFVDRAREIRSRNVELVRRFVANARGVTADLGAPPFCLVRYARGPDSVAFARALLKRTGVLVSPGDFFGAPRAFRLCFTCSEDTLRSGLDEISAFLDRQR